MRDTAGDNNPTTLLKTSPVQEEEQRSPSSDGSENNY